MFHGSAAVGDCDELGVFRKAEKIIRIAVNIRFIKRRFDFVQDAKRCGANLEDSKIDCDCNKSLFAAGKGSEVVDDFSRRLNLYLDAGFKNVIRIAEGKLSFAAADETKPTEATMEISVNGSDYAVVCRLFLLEKLNYTPTVALTPALSLQIETYKDLPTAGTVSAYDPEGDEITYEITRYASHGRISLTDRHTGAYVYTPDPGFTGQDSFDYVVRDRYGNYSTSATVAIQVSPRPYAVTYADIDGEGNAAAILTVTEWGLMNGAKVGSETYFKPAAAVSRLEFLVTAMEAAGITAETVATAAPPAVADAESLPAAMRPYVGYALQKGYINGKTVEGKVYLRPDEAITRAEAAVVLSNIIGYAVEDTVTAFADENALPAWSGEAFTSLRALGVLQCPDGSAHAGETMTRGDTAEWLCRTVRLMEG